MIKQNPDSHLTYDELLQTLADASDLIPEQQAHLESCHRCRRQAEDLQHRYHRLGKMARNMAPEPSRPFRVRAHQMPKSRWYLQPGVAVGILGVLVFVFTVWWPHPTDHSHVPVPAAAYNAEEEAQLMAEVDALLNDALPKAFQLVAVAPEPILSEDLIDWIVPSIDEDDETVEPRA